MQRAVPTISAITICKNSAATIERALLSVTSSAYPKLQYVIVDGGSTDGTLAVIERHRAHVAKLVSEPDGGISEALNKAIALSDGEYHIIVHADDELLPGALERLGEAGFDYVAGLEVEFHIFKLENPRLALDDAGQPGPPPEVSLLTQGYQHLTELRYDQLDPVLEILRRNIVGLGLPLRTLEVEYGPSQCEFTFQPRQGLEPADMMMLARSAMKQVCRRHGYLASFMCRPRIPNVFSSGWHMHQSLRDKRTGANAFVPTGSDVLSPIGRHYLAGLLEHAPGAAALATPTINGYRRYGRHPLAPDRAVWGHDHRNVMVRVLGAPGDSATRLENRVGEPAANPYLYMASQVLSGLDGIERQLDPGPPSDAPYETAAPMLPRSLTEAIAALRKDVCLRAGLGNTFIDYYSLIKEAEVARFELEVTEWEQREYFEIF